MSEVCYCKAVIWSISSNTRACHFNDWSVEAVWDRGLSWTSIIFFQQYQWIFSLSALLLVIDYFSKCTQLKSYRRLRLNVRKNTWWYFLLKTVDTIDDVLCLGNTNHNPWIESFGDRRSSYESNWILDMKVLEIARSTSVPETLMVLSH